MYLLGDVFLRQFYSVYDFEKRTIKLGVNVHSYPNANISIRPCQWANLVIFCIILAPFCSFLAIIHGIFEREIQSKFRPYTASEIIVEREQLLEKATCKISGHIYIKPGIRRPERTNLGTITEVLSAQEADSNSTYRL